ncbi:hypothetical protein IKQ26_05635 [bacterium]|nr:hypothetical protein [bacterium]
MKIVIDIPQGLKIDFENENWTALTCAEMKEALMRGTPLPKGLEVLDKIRAEIVDLGQRTMNDNRAGGIWACRDIIDKYKAESEV